MDPSKNQDNSKPNTLNLPKITVTKTGPRLIKKNFDKTNKSKNYVNDSEPDRLKMTQPKHLTSTNLDFDKQKSDSIFVDAFTRWMRKSVGRILYQLCLFL